jgi:hypothetical protein
MKPYTYVIKLPDGQYVGPFDNKIDARIYLIKKYGNRNAGLVILVLPPRDKDR